MKPTVETRVRTPTKWAFFDEHDNTPQSVCADIGAATLPKSRCRYSQTAYCHYNKQCANCTVELTVNQQAPITKTSPHD